MQKREDRTEGATAPSAPSYTYAELIGSGLLGGTDMNVATVYGCIDVLGGNVSRLKFMYMRKRGGIFVPDDTTDINYYLNVQPNAYMSSVDFWRLAISHLYLKGNVYIVPKVSAAARGIEGLYLVNPDNVYHNVVNNTYTIQGSYDDINGTYRECDIIHVKNITLDGKEGISTIAYARRNIRTALAADNEMYQRFENGGNVRGIVSNESSGVSGFGQVQDQELARTAATLDERFRRGERIVSVPGDAKFNQVTLSSQDLQFLQSKEVNALDICRFFHVPPEAVFYSTGTNYKSVEFQKGALLNDALDPLLNKFEKEFIRKFIPKKYAMTKECFAFEREGLFACDLMSMVAYQEKTIAAGQMTVNEWRAKNNRPPVEGGDKVLISANLVDINDINKKGEKPEEANTNDNK